MIKIFIEWQAEVYSDYMSACSRDYNRYDYICIYIVNSSTYIDTIGSTIIAIIVDSSMILSMQQLYV